MSATASFSTAYRSLARAGAAALAALAAGALAMLAGMHSASWMMVAAAGAVLIFFVLPRAWIFVLPALVPVLDLRPFTGFLLFGEYDLLVLAVLAGGYARAALGRRTFARVLPGAPDPAFATMVLLFAVTLGASAVLGWVNAAPPDAAAPASYYSPVNALRLLAGPLFALALWPLWQRAVEHDAPRAGTLFIAGTLAGLAGACLSVLWERIAFPGLTNFSSDYRVTGLFADTHVGGAALDGYLMLALPFCLFLLRPALAWPWRAAGLVLFAVAMYAILVTFTRTTYVAAALVVPLLCLFAMRGGAREIKSVGKSALPGALTLIALAIVLCAWTFSAGGYRTLAATLGVLAIGFHHGGTPRTRATHGALLIWGLPAAALALASLVVPKGIYLAYAGIVGAYALGALTGRAPVGMATGLFFAAGVAAPAVGVYWSEDGTRAVLAAGTVSVFAWAVAAFNRRARRPWWRADAAHLMPAVLLILPAALAIPVAGSYYMSARIASIGTDSGGRMHHFRSGLAMIDDTVLARSLGMGLGRFPEVYYWRNLAGEYPGTFAIGEDDDGRFLRLIGPRYAIGYGDTLRLGQAVPQPQGVWFASFRARNAGPPAALYLNLCAKHLLYPQACAGAAVGLKSAQWTRFNLPLNRKGEADARGALPRPHFIMLGVDAQGARVDIDDFQLLDASGRPLIANGGFEAGMADWFYFSDHYHLAYHAKNILIHVLFEQGGAGLIAFLLMIVLATWRAARKGGDAPLLAVAIGGFMVVGMFDTLIDVTRLSMLFYFVVLVCASRAAQGAADPWRLDWSRRRRHIRTTAPA
ncbi:MAG: hypothetical protein JNM79_05275 [Burkholderiales bacterium]|nr:hypothetical protein [Burkholderiales bacterium]